MNILIINGPNLNLLGKREPGIYGNKGFETHLEQLKLTYPTVTFEYFQSNIEGELIDKLHAFGFKGTGIILNAGAYTHTSIALRDAISAISIPVVEVHISNTLSREAFRHTSVIGPVCKGCIMGFGLLSYNLAVESFMVAAEY